MSDFSESERIASRMQTCTRKLHELAPALGAAKQVREFNSDQRKNALAAEMLKAIKDGQSGVAAETQARSSPIYLAQLEQLARECASAEQTIAEWTATQCSFEASRSLLAMSRETLKTMPE